VHPRRDRAPACAAPDQRLGILPAHVMPPTEPYPPIRCSPSGGAQMTGLGTTSTVPGRAERVSSARQIAHGALDFRVARPSGQDTSSSFSSCAPQRCTPARRGQRASPRARSYGDSSCNFAASSTKIRLDRRNNDVRVHSGFRSFGSKPVTVDLANDLTTIVGPNASGKTALLQFLSKLFGVTRA
jgi:AAA domain